MIDLDHEKALTLSEAAKLPMLARDGRRPHSSTLWRWAARGVRGVRLETRAIGGSTVTTAAAVKRFIDALSNPIDFQPSVEHSRQLERATSVLNGAGI